MIVYIYIYIYVIVYCSELICWNACDPIGILCMGSLGWKPRSECKPCVVWG